MARARNIKPGFFQNEDLAELEPLARLAFIGMWTIADYKGCIEYRPKRLKVQILPYDDCSMDEIVSALDKSGFISTYSVRGQAYIKIANFEKHQNPHKNEREAGSDIPDFDEKAHKINVLEKIQINPEQNGSAPADSLFPITDSPIPKEIAQAKPSPAECAEVFAYWQQAMSSPRSILDDKRKKLINQALKNGYSKDQLLEAIRGCSLSAFHMGDNDRRMKYNGLDLILRNAEQIDKFIDIAANPSSRQPARTVHDISKMDYSKGVDENGRF